MQIVFYPSYFDFFLKIVWVVWKIFGNSNYTGDYHVSVVQDGICGGTMLTTTNSTHVSVRIYLGQYCTIVYKESGDRE